jgi:hypothetical protein
LTASSFVSAAIAVRTSWRNGGDVRICGGAAHASPDHGRADEISYAKRIIFIGYSFPPTDFYSQWLFRQVYFLQKHRPEIVVVNPEMKKQQFAREALSKFVQGL